MKTIPLADSDTISSIMKYINFDQFDEHADFSGILCKGTYSPYELESHNTFISDPRPNFTSCQILLEIPRYSTIANAYLISKLVELMPPSSAYLNVGVWCGFSYLAPLVSNPDKKCIGVDNFSQFGGPKEYFEALYNAVRNANSRYYDMDYMHYFEKVHKEPLGVYFYDGEHSYENQLKGLEVAEPFLINGAYVVVDDTNDPEPFEATMDFISARPDKYLILLNKKTAHNSHPTYWNGLMILQKVS